MPIYLYLCASKKCRHITEDVRSLDTQVIECPKCGKPSERKMEKAVTGRPVIK